MSCNGAQRLLQILAHHGIDILSGIPGGNILPLYDAIHRTGFRHILARHEQGAAFIAQGIARSTGRLGVCLATSGPGATNLLTGIADAHRDSIPLLAVTGQVPRASIGTQAFQEIDIASMAAACTKAVFRIEGADELDRIVPEAISIALSGRPGPVLVDIPKDIFLEECPGGPLPAIQTRALRDPSRRELDEASRELAKSRRPLLYVGGGIASAGAQDALRRFARGRRIPAVSTLLGLGAFRHDDPSFLGMLGMHGSPAANRALEECDLLIVAGARFDDRATSRMDAWCTWTPTRRNSVGAGRRMRRSTVTHAACWSCGTGRIPFGLHRDGSTPSRPCGPRSRRRPNRPTTCSVPSPPSAPPMPS